MAGNWLQAYQPENEITHLVILMVLNLMSEYRVIQQVVKLSLVDLDFDFSTTVSLTQLRLLSDR